MQEEKMDGVLLLFTFRVHRRDESAGRDGDGTWRILLKSSTGHQTENVMRHKGLPAHIKQMISAWVMLSWHYRLKWDWMIMPAAEGGGQVKKKYSDKSLTVYLMHTKFSVLHRVLLCSFAHTLGLHHSISPSGFISPVWLSANHRWCSEFASHCERTLWAKLPTLSPWRISELHTKVFFNKWCQNILYGWIQVSYEIIAS